MSEARRGVSIPAAREDCGVVNLRCVNGTSGGAWVGVVLAPPGCGENCGLPRSAYGSWPISACWAGQSCQSRQKLSKCSFCLQDNGWVGVSGNWCLIRVPIGGGRLYHVEMAGSLNFLSVGNQGGLTPPRVSHTGPLRAGIMRSHER